MKIYLAARYDRRWQMLAVASMLERAGHEVTSRWIEGGRGDDPAFVPAVEALRDLARADCLVAFTEEPPIFPVASSGERHVELGIALATGKRVCVVGPRETIFHHLLSAERYVTVADLVAGLNAQGVPKHEARIAIKAEYTRGDEAGRARDPATRSHRSTTR